jgi:hypothetical protein
MATTQTTVWTTPAVSTTGTLERRTINDKIRNLFPGAAQLFALVATGEVKKGEVKKSAGLIGKKGVDTRRYEWFTYTPLATYVTVSSVSGSNITLSSATGLTIKRTLLNTRNMHVGRISSITSTVITVTAITSSFDVQAADTLLIMAPAYPENSSGPLIIGKDDDNNYNVTQIMRYPVAISASAKGNPHMGGNFWQRLKEKNMVEGNRLTEKSFLFGERPTSGDTTSDSTVGDSFGTFRGVWNFAGYEYDCGLAMTPEKFRKNLPLAMSDTINPAERVVFLTSRTIRGEMLEWVNDKLMYIDGESDLKRFGIDAKKFLTNGPTIEVMVHDAFDQPGMTNKGLIIVPDECLYVFKNGRDLQPKQGIQNNDVDGYEDEIIGELGFAELTGGAKITKVVNWFAL